MTDFNGIVDRYLAVWNEPDAEARAAAIADLFTPESRYTDPQAEVTGADGIAAVIAGARDMFGGHVFRRHGQIDGHHDIVRFGWELVPAGGGEPLVIGWDVAVLADGKITSVHGFLDKVPATA